MRRLALILALIASPLMAVQPDEVLDDPALEARARALSEGLRCLVCRNENIDASNAPLARDLRLLVRERLMAGDTDDEAINYIVDRYGEYVLLNPRATGSTLFLWLAGPAMLLLGAGIAVIYIRKRGQATPEDGQLSDDEAARLRDILNR
ncbi:cytochrome c-type biogenesis protein [Roseovarius sp. S1116L3]|uniref:cytochrome c-type biogenesis protein n=1 Tax=Roseovarius roseus TaxID=3342636 RepID=UPI00372A42CE